MANQQRQPSTCRISAINLQPQTISSFEIFCGHRPPLEGFEHTPKRCYSTWKNSFFSKRLIHCCAATHSKPFHLTSGAAWICCHLQGCVLLLFVAWSQLIIFHLYRWVIFFHGKIMNPNGRKDQRRSTTNNKGQKKKISTNWRPDMKIFNLPFSTNRTIGYDSYIILFEHRCVETYSYLNLNQSFGLFGTLRLLQVGSTWTKQQPRNLTIWSPKWHQHSHIWKELPSPNHHFSVWKLNFRPIVNTSGSVTWGSKTKFQANCFWKISPGLSIHLFQMSKVQKP